VSELSGSPVPEAELLEAVRECPCGLLTSHGRFHGCFYHPHQKLETLGVLGQARRKGCQGIGVTSQVLEGDTLSEVCLERKGRCTLSTLRPIGKRGLSTGHRASTGDTTRPGSKHRGQLTSENTRALQLALTTITLLALGTPADINPFSGTYSWIVFIVS
jgi:hypothetical protein